MTNPSLFIPRIHRNTHQHTTNNFSSLEEYIKHKFSELGIGKVSSIDILPYNTGNKETSHQNIFCKAFVHFSEWYNTDIANNVITEISQENGSTKFYYSENRYWILRKNNSKKKTNNIHNQVEQLQQQINKLYMMINNTNSNGKRTRYQ